MIARTLPALSRAVDGFRAMKATVALIPTRAHSVSAMRDWRFAKRRTNKLNVSIFVNRLSSRREKILTPILALGNPLLRNSLLEASRPKSFRGSSDGRPDRLYSKPRSRNSRRIGSGIAAIVPAAALPRSGGTASAVK
jgi:hypothetical protein